MLFFYILTAGEMSNDLTLGDRMKGYERRAESNIPDSSSYVFRLDGRGFSKFTRNMQQPWDPRFTTAMSLTAGDLLDEFKPASVYVQSDEITMCFPIKINSTTGEIVKPMFSGRIQKLTSVVAGFASARFNYHLRQLYHENPETHAIDKFITSLKGKYSIEESFPLRYINLETPVTEKQKANILSGRAHFDARCIYFDEGKEYEIINCILWRTRDCFRNAVSKTIQYRIGHKRCNNLRTDDKVELMDKEFPGELEAVPNSVLYGTFMVKEKYDTCINDKPVIRSRIVMFSGDMRSTSEDEKESWKELIFGKANIDNIKI